MKYFQLVWASLFRKKARTTLTLLSVVAAFLLFGLLDAVRVAFTVPDESLDGAKRLVVSSKLSIIQPLPYSLKAQIDRIDGVEKSGYANWFGGIYQDQKNFFPNFAVSPEYIELYPELALPPEQKKAFAETRTGAIVGENLAKKFGWKIGDKIPLQATIFPNKTGGNTWTFDLVGIFHGATPEDRRNEDQMIFRYDYFDEGRTFGTGTVGWYVVKAADPAQANRIAQQIDKLSANSANETKTQTEKEFQLAFVKQLGDIGLIVTSIMAAVFFTILLLTGNTMAQAVRERIPELAVLKTIGFGNRTVLGLVLGEALLLIALGGFIGLGLAAGAAKGLSAAFQGGVFALTPRSWLLGALIILALGLIVGLPPALRAMRLKIVDALSGH